VSRRKDRNVRGELLAGWDDLGMVTVRAGAWGWCWYSVCRLLGTLPETTEKTA
jgi:hypothetical protein